MKYVSEFSRKFSILLLSAILLSAYSAAKAASNYVLSGSPDGSGTIFVDEDLDVYLNGNLIYTDGANSAGDRSPINFSADVGSVLRIVVRDGDGDCASLSSLYLTDTAGNAIIADHGFDLGCGRPTTDQGIVHDTTLSIPDFTPLFKAWGSNRYGQFGNGQTSDTDQLTPIPLSLPNISDIDSGFYVTGFLRTDGIVLVSGTNSSGAAGQGYVSLEQVIPDAVPNLANVVQISAGGDDFFLARLANGTVRSWGANGQGELGNGSISTNSCQCVPAVQTCSPTRPSTRRGDRPTWRWTTCVGTARSSHTGSVSTSSSSPPCRASSSGSGTGGCRSRAAYRRVPPSR